MKNLFSFKRSGLVLGGILALSLFMTSCLKDNDNNDPQTDAAGLMGFNLATDQTAVGLSISGNVLTPNALNFTSYTGTYLGIYPGNRPVESFDANNGGSLATASFNFQPKKYYSVFVAGADSNYRNIIVEDVFDSLSYASGKAYVRFINAIPDSSAPQVNITSGAGNVISRTASFAFVSDFVEADPGQLTIDVTNSGNIDTDRTINVDAHKIYTILLTGAPGSAIAPIAIKYVENGMLEEGDGAGRPATGARGSAR